MEKKYYIFGKEYSKKELQSFIASKINGLKLQVWEREIFEFIKEWLDDSLYIKANTSGTTGVPKLIKLSKQEMRESANSTVDFFGLRRKDSVLLCLSPLYIAGKMMIVRALEYELNLIYCEPLIDSLKRVEQDVKFCAMVPYQVSKLFGECPQLFSKIKSLIIGGGAINSALNMKLQAINTHCYATYGMTETMSHIALKRINGDKDNAYICLPKIYVSTDDRGCLIINYRGIQNIVTNDLVDVVNNKCFVWKGRYDNVINSGGIKFIPEVLEHKVSDIIDDRFIFSSISDSLLGYKLILIIESLEYSANKMSFLWKELNNRLEKYEVPKHIYFVSKFEETSSGKIIRRGLAL